MATPAQASVLNYDGTLELDLPDFFSLADERLIPGSETGVSVEEDGAFSISPGVFETQFLILFGFYDFSAFSAKNAVGTFGEGVGTMGLRGYARGGTINTSLTVRLDLSGATPGTWQVVYDTRTPEHRGRIQFVAPMRVPRTTMGFPPDPDSAPIVATLTLHFVPEPNTLMLLSCGVLALCAIGARRRSNSGRRGPAKELEG